MRKLLLLFSCSAALLTAADLAGVHSVYLLPMSRGMDQYLANRLTADHVVQVVTNPKMADAVITDRIGEAFESQMDGLFPPPPEKTEKPAPPKDSKEAKKSTDQNGPPLPTDMNKLSDPSLNSAFGRGKGMVFVVDVKSRQVVWSGYEPPKGMAVTDLEKSAVAIVAHLKKDLGK